LEVSDEKCICSLAIHSVIRFLRLDSLQTCYRRTAGTLEYPSSVAKPIVYHFHTDVLPDCIYEDVITGIEVEPGLHDIFLLGKTKDSEIPLLMGTSEYRGNYNFVKSDSRYHEEEDEIMLFATGGILIPECLSFCDTFREILHSKRWKEQTALWQREV